MLCHFNQKSGMGSLTVLLDFVADAILPDNFCVIQRYRFFTGGLLANPGSDGHSDILDAWNVLHILFDRAG